MTPRSHYVQQDGGDNVCTTAHRWIADAARVGCTGAPLLLSSHHAVCPGNAKFQVLLLAFDTRIGSIEEESEYTISRQPIRASSSSKRHVRRLPNLLHSLRYIYGHVSLRRRYRSGSPSRPHAAGHFKLSAIKGQLPSLATCHIFISLPRTMY